MHSKIVKEIGSEFWIDSEPSKINGAPAWLAAYGKTSLFSSGRGAITSVLQGARDRGFERAVLPSYLCEAMIVPFERAGFKIEFHSLNASLECDMEEIKKMCARERSILFHMGYFGFDTNLNIKKATGELEKLGTFVMEDITHTLFSDVSSSGAHCKVASLRKWMGLPSGGAVFCDDENIVRSGNIAHQKLVDIRLKALSLKGRFIENGDVLLKKEFLELFAEGEKILNNDVNAYAIDPVSMSILGGVNIGEIKSKRSANYEHLFRELSCVKWIRPVFGSLPDNVCPIFFPFFCENGEREKVRDSDYRFVIRLLRI